MNRNYSYNFINDSFTAARTFATTDISLPMAPRMFSPFKALKNYDTPVKFCPDILLGLKPFKEVAVDNRNYTCRAMTGLYMYHESTFFIFL